MDLEKMSADDLMGVFGDQGLADILATMNQRLQAAGTSVIGRLVASDAAAGVFSWQNTTGHACAIKAFLNITTASTGAGTVSVGQAATAVSSANLMDTQSVAAAGMLSSMVNGGTLGKAVQLVKNGEFVTASRASGATAGLAGTYMLEIQYLD